MLGSDASGRCAVPPGSQIGRSAARMQSDWLQAARWRILRRADVARRSRVLDVAAGWGDASLELARRSRGFVVALDRQLIAPASDPLRGAARIHRVVADAQRLPFRDAAFDLVFVQLALLWIADPSLAIREMARVVEPRGAVVAIEPDFGGLMEYPEAIELRDVWLAALRRAGADPEIGRRLPTLMAAAGLLVEVQFLDRLEPPSPLRLDLLAELPLTAAEQERVEAVRGSFAQAGTVHLPFWIVVGRKPE